MTKNRLKGEVTGIFIMQVFAAVVIAIGLAMAVVRCAPLPTMPEPSGSTGGTSPAQGGASACTSYPWKERGKAPAGYIQGVAAVYHKVYCQYVSPAVTPAGVMGKALGDESVDALAYSKLNPATGVDRLRATWTLLIGLGMRESAGNYGEGFDKSAGPETASEAEAGAWQFSYNSIGASPALRSLYDEYQAHPSACLLEVFREGARGSYQGLIGTGAGADFQRFTKSCPAFQAEYAAVLLRTLRKHFGPINRREVEYVPACEQMLRAQEAAVCR